MSVSFHLKSHTARDQFATIASSCLEHLVDSTTLQAAAIVAHLVLFRTLQILSLEEETEGRHHPASLLVDLLHDAVTNVPNAQPLRQVYLLEECVAFFGRRVDAFENLTAVMSIDPDRAMPAVNLRSLSESQRLRKNLSPPSSLRKDSQSSWVVEQTDISLTILQCH